MTTVGLSAPSKQCGDLPAFDEDGEVIFYSLGRGPRRINLSDRGYFTARPGYDHASGLANSMPGSRC
jgi:hypothetical protein